MSKNNAVGEQWKSAYFKSKEMKLILIVYVCMKFLAIFKKWKNYCKCTEH